MTKMRKSTGRMLLSACIFFIIMLGMNLRVLADESQPVEADFSVTLDVTDSSILPDTSLPRTYTGGVIEVVSANGANREGILLNRYNPVTVRTLYGGKITKAELTFVNSNYIDDFNTEDDNFTKTSDGNTVTFTADTSASVETFIIKMFNHDSPSESNYITQVKVWFTSKCIIAPPTVSPAFCGETLGNVELNGGVAAVPGTFSWEIPNTTRNNPGTINCRVNYIPADSAFQEIYDKINIDIPVTFVKRDRDIDDDGLGNTRLKGYSVSLDGGIGANFYMELSEEVIANKDNAYMEFTVPNGSGTETQKVLVKDAGTVTMKVYDDTETYYCFTCHVSAKDMNSTIKAKIVNGNETGTEYTFTVKDYADCLLDSTADDCEYVPLIKALLNYGTAAQEYFGVTGNGPANASLSAKDKDLSGVTADLINPPAYTKNLPEGVELAKVSLSLRSETTLSLYFKGIGPATDFSCKTNRIDKEKNGEYTIVRIRNIHATDLGNSCQVLIGNNSGSVNYSPMNFCKTVLNGGSNDAKLQNVCRALYKYNQAALAVKGTTVSSRK